MEYWFNILTHCWLGILFFLKISYVGFFSNINCFIISLVSMISLSYGNNITINYLSCNLNQAECILKCQIYKMNSFLDGIEISASSSAFISSTNFLNNSLSSQIVYNHNIIFLSIDWMFSLQTTINILLNQIIFSSNLASSKLWIRKLKHLLKKLIFLLNLSIVYSLIH